MPRLRARRFLEGDEAAQLLVTRRSLDRRLPYGATMTETWIAPAVDRTESPNVAPERIAAEALLDYFRETLLWKCAGLSAEQLKQRSVPPSSMSLLGLVRHMAEVERVWFRTRVAGENLGPIFCSDTEADGDFDDVDAADAEADFATYQREVDAARAVLAARGFDDTFALTRRDGTGEVTIDVRAVVLHMIEEYARHCGHADLIRECVDGAIGD
jgi:uncharacterized damage-inducible protein DinB